jgi:hypothetical protein
METKNLDEICNVEIVKSFDKLCERAKSYFWDWVSNSDESLLCLGDAIMNYEIFNHNLSPIEQIFNICYYRYVNEFLYCSDKIKHKFNNYYELPLNVIFLEEFYKQKEIFANGKKYICDFCIDFTRKTTNKEHIYPKIKKLKYIIELDGKEYHSNKHQINYDYEREQNLQLCGYKIIRFTGSQIYNKPYDCIDRLINIILNDVEKEV